MNRRKRTRYLIRRLIRTTLARVRETKRKEKTRKQSTSPRSPRANATPPGGRRGGSRAHRHAAAGRCRRAAERERRRRVRRRPNATAGEAPAPNAGTADAGVAPNVNPVDASDVTGDSRPEETFFARPRPQAAGAPNANAAPPAGGPSGFGSASFGSRAEPRTRFPAVEVAQRRAQQGVVVLFPPLPALRATHDTGAEREARRRGVGGPGTKTRGARRRRRRPRRFRRRRLRRRRRPRRSRREADRRARLERSSGPSPPREAVHVSAGSRPVT